jgi:sulfide dehydrogenase cytochrome subunit
MFKRYTEFTLLACAVLISLFLTANAWAGDVNTLVKVCADCHGKGGASTEPEVPIIGGYSVEFLVNNLKAYKTQDRDCPDTKFRAGSNKGKKTNMCNMVKDLNDSDVNKVAQYFSKQKFVRAKQKFDPALAAKGKEVHNIYCEKCHSEGGTVADDEAGLPAGQWMPYLRQAFEEFNTGKRPTPKKMKRKMDELEPADIEALINYYASFN